MIGRTKCYYTKGEDPKCNFPFGKYCMRLLANHYSAQTSKMTPFIPTHYSYKMITPFNSDQHKMMRFLRSIASQAFKIWNDISPSYIIGINWYNTSSLFSHQNYKWVTCRIIEKEKHVSIANIENQPRTAVDFPFHIMVVLESQRNVYIRLSNIFCTSIDN